MSDDRRRIPEFYKLSVEERVRAVHERGLVTGSDFRALATGKHTLDTEAADKMDRERRWRYRSAAGSGHESAR